VPVGAGSVQPNSRESGERDDTRSDAGTRAAAHAAAMVDMPYRYGGTSPRTGFDCSGLVQYSYHRAGLAVPRSTAEQRRGSRVVHVSALRPGDLVFFDQEGKKSSHVGIYVGGRQFIHAPSSGKRVRKDRLDSPYWRKHLSEARRFSS
jgi:murein DD-endopeptidase